MPADRCRGIIAHVGKLRRVGLLGSGHITRCVGNLVERVTDVTDKNLVVLLDRITVITRTDEMEIQVVVAVDLQVILFSPDAVFGLVVDDAYVLPLHEVLNQLVLGRTFGRVTVLVAGACSDEEQQADDKCCIMLHNPLFAMLSSANSMSAKGLMCMVSCARIFVYGRMNAFPVEPYAIVHGASSRTVSPGTISRSMKR